MIINVNGQPLEAAKLLAALYNRAVPRGMGFLHAQPGLWTAEDAAAWFSEADENQRGLVHADYVLGRVVKVTFRRAPEEMDLEASRRLFDRDNGEGSFDSALAEALAT